MENFQFPLLTYRLEAQIFLGRSHQAFLQLCLCVVVFETCSFHTLSHVTLMALNENFFVTPLALHTWRLSCISDQIGQCLLPQTSSLVTCDSTLDSLPSGLGTLRSDPACVNIFLTRVYRNLYVKFSYPHTNEECSNWEMPALTDERTVFSSTCMCAGWRSNCWPFCHPYPQSPYDDYNPSQFAALWLFLPHYRNYLPLGHSEYSSTCLCLTCPATVLPSSQHWFLRECLPFSVLLSSVLGLNGMPLLFSLTVPQQ
jgi:hypothetical protein